MNKPKRSPGRPKMNILKRNVGMPEQDWTKAKEIGSGNQSKGIRMAITAYEQKEQDK